MKYTLEVNQKAIIDNGLDLSLVEAALLNVITYMTLNWDDMTRIQHGGTMFFWLDYDKVNAEAPMLKLKADSTYRHIKALAEKGFLMAHPDNRKLQKPFYAIMPLAALAFGKKSEPSEKNPNLRKKIRTTYGEKSEPRTENFPYNNNTIDNTTNDNSVDDKSSTQKRAQNFAENFENDFENDFEKNAGRPDGGSGEPPVEGRDFFEFCRANGLLRLAGQPLFLTKEKSCAKKEKYGAAGYLATLQKLEGYLAEKPRYLDGKKDLSRIFDKFAINPQAVIVFVAFKSAFLAHFGGVTPKCSSSDEKHAIAILAGLSEVLAVPPDSVPSDKVADFFKATFTLSAYKAATSAKLAFIAKDFAQIIGDLRKNKSQAGAAGGLRKTYAQIEREESERRAKEALAQRQAKSEYDSNMRVIMHVVQSGGDFTAADVAWLTHTQAYRDFLDGANAGAGNAEVF